MQYNLQEVTSTLSEPGHTTPYLLVMRLVLRTGLVSMLLGLPLFFASCTPSRETGPAPTKPAANVQAKVEQAPVSAAPATVAEGADFTAQAKLLYRVVACTGNEALPSTLDAGAVEEYCKWLRPKIAQYRRDYLAKARPFFASLEPADLPPNVVYPFGGGDLLSALTTYPQARRITTLSLELVGDPRRIEGIDREHLVASLDELRATLAGLLTQDDSTSESLKTIQQGELPGQLSFFLIALAVHGYEPVSLRYFRLERDGTPHYLSQAEIQGLEKKTAHRRKVTWTPPDFSEAFANSELVFRAQGGGANSPLLTHRHLAANLDDAHLRRDPWILKYLVREGRVAAMTKAASFLLWNPAFSRMRKYLLTNMDFMISDSTGIPPAMASEAGFVQETYGSFHGSYLDASEEYNDEFRELWAKQPHRKLRFRYGYLDSAKSYHLLVTRRARRSL